MSTPEKVEPGQVWRDRDERSAGAGEFEVMDVYQEVAGRNRGAMVAYVFRRAVRRYVTIRVDRLLKGRDYEYIGRQR